MIKLFKFEFDKIVKSKYFLSSFIGSLFILAGIFFVGYVFSQNYTSQKSNEESGYKKNIDDIIQEQYSGTFTDDKIKLILSDYLDIKQNVDKGGMSFSFYPFYWETGKTFFSDGIYEFSSKVTESDKNNTLIKLTDSDINSIEELGFTQFEQPLTIGNYVPWSDLFKTLGNIFILSNILVILFCSLVFADDTSKNINQLLFTTKEGRRKMNATKIWVSIITSISIFLLFQLLNFLVFSSIFDTSGGISSIQTNFALQLFNFPFYWTHWNIFFFILFIQTLGLVFTMSITLWVSSFSKTTISAFSTSLGIFFLPFLLKQLFKTGLPNNLLYLFPINFASPFDILSKLNSDNFLSHSFSTNSLILLIFLAVSGFFLTMVSYNHIKNWKFQ